MKTDIIEFKTVKRFRMYAVTFKKNFFSRWDLVSDKDGVTILFTEKEAQECMKQLEETGHYDPKK